jgi:translation initiation factor IF-2
MVSRLRHRGGRPRGAHRTSWRSPRARAGGGGQDRREKAKVVAEQQQKEKEEAERRRREEEEAARRLLEGEAPEGGAVDADVAAAAILSAGSAPAPAGAAPAPQTDARADAILTGGDLPAASTPPPPEPPPESAPESADERADEPAPGDDQPVEQTTGETERPNP